MTRLLLILLLGLPLVLRAGEPDQAGEGIGIRRIHEVLERLNPVLTKYQLAPLSFTPSEILIFHPKDTFRKINVWNFQTLRVTFNFLPGSFELLSLNRLDINYTPGTGYDNPPKPKWTEDKAVTIAKDYAQAIFDGFPKDTGPPLVTFEDNMNLPQYSSVMKYYPGRWHIRWPRTDGKGHQFALDAIHVYVSEDQGLASASYNVFSNYQESTGPFISQEEALKISYPVAESLMVKWLDSGMQLGSHKVGEYIVNPNHAFQAKTAEALGQMDTTARLAWVIRYEITAKNVSVSEHSIQVQIDAQTKQVIGGDFH